MKARIPPKIPKQLKQEAERIAKSAYKQIREKENKDITRRVFKTNNGKVVNFEGDEENETQTGNQ